LSGRDPAARDFRTRHPLRTSFNNVLSVEFDSADRGILVIEARMRDFDTRSTIVCRYRVRIRPVGPVFPRSPVERRRTSRFFSTPFTL
jgi:hypothetical protein